MSVSPRYTLGSYSLGAHHLTIVSVRGICKTKNCHKFTIQLNACNADRKPRKLLAELARSPSLNAGTVAELRPGTRQRENRSQCPMNLRIASSLRAWHAAWSGCRITSATACREHHRACWSRSTDLADMLSVGDRCRLVDRDGEPTLAEVVGFRAGRSLLMPYGAVARIGPGCRAEVGGDDDAIYPERGWLGRVVGALGRTGRRPRAAGDWLSALSAAQRAAAGARAASGCRASSTSACARSTPF